MIRHVLAVDEASGENIGIFSLFGKQATELHVGQQTQTIGDRSESFARGLLCFQNFLHGRLVEPPMLESQLTNVTRFRSGLLDEKDDRREVDDFVLRQPVTEAMFDGEL